MNAATAHYQIPTRLRLLATCGPQNDVTKELREMANQLSLFLRDLDVAVKALVDHTPSSFYTEQLEQFTWRPQ